MNDAVHGWSKLWIAVNLLAGGCVFTVDASVVKGNGADASPPGVDASQEAGEDAGADGDAPDPDGDLAEPDAGVDADVRPPDCEDGGCPRACSGDSDCEADEYCSKQGGTCAPRCDGTLGCAGPREAQVAGSVTDGSSLYWATRPPADWVGNQPDGTIWSWDLHGEPVQIASGPWVGWLAFEADEQLYFHSEAGLSRVSLSEPSTPELLAENVATSWSSNDYIYWSTGVRDGEPAELWRLERSASETRVRLATSADYHWHGGDDNFVFHIEPRDVPPKEYSEVGVLVADQLPDLSNRRELVTKDGWYNGVHLIVEGSILYFISPRFQDCVTRLDLNAPSGLRILSPCSNEVAGVSFLVRDGWIYWSAVIRGASETFDVIYARSHVNLAFRNAELLHRTTSKPSHEIAVVGQQMVYWNADEERVFTLPLPPLPCSADVPCPDAQTCNTDLLCE